MGSDLYMEDRHAPPEPVHVQAKRLEDRVIEQNTMINAQRNEIKGLKQSNQMLKDVVADQEVKLRSAKANASAALATLRMEIGQLPEGIQYHNHVEAQLLGIIDE